MPSEPQKKNEIHIDGNVNGNIIIGDSNAISQTSQTSEVSKAKLLLRLKQQIEKEDHYRIELEFDDGDSRQTPEARFDFKMTDSDRADLRWYLEDYLQYPLDPAPKIAERIEGRIRELGIELFKKIFQANDDTRDLWATLRDRLADTRVEVATDVKARQLCRGNCCATRRRMKRWRYARRRLSAVSTSPRKRFTSRSPLTRCGFCW